MRLIASRSGPLRGDVAVPGDKSISHRALLLGALATGRSAVRGLLEGEDVRATWQALAALGVTIERDGDAVGVHGVGVGGLRAPTDILDLGNAGTGVRLLMGLLAGHGFASTLTGDASLRRRPMGRVLRPLAGMGVRYLAREGDRLPLTMLGSDALQPLAYASPVASAQVKSAILLAGLHALGETRVSEPVPSRDHTETMLAAMGATVTRSVDEDGRPTVALMGRPELRPFDLDVPADPSSAAFPLVAALLRPGSSVTLRNVMLNPTRAGLFDVLRQMGADIVERDRRQLAGEAVADLVVTGSELLGIEVPEAVAASMIDEYPVLAVAAALASGRTVMRGIGELRVKESDRLAAMANGLEAAGLAVEAGPDWLAVTGTGGAAPAGGNRVDAGHDHRIAMSFLVLGQTSAAPIAVDGAETIATSFPGFVELMQGLGCGLQVA